jgi:hypothetical protein
MNKWISEPSDAVLRSFHVLDRADARKVRSRRQLIYMANCHSVYIRGSLPTRIVPNSVRHYDFVHGSPNFFISTAS